MILQTSSVTASPPLQPEDLQRFMRLHKIKGEILFLEEETLTVESAARALGTSPEQIAKSVLFLIKQHPSWQSLAAPARLSDALSPPALA